MKIAFVGKGGSGKSTLTALYIKHLLKHNKQILAIDADINMHLADLLGIELDHSLNLSESKNVLTIKAHLAGNNPRIKKPSQIVKTTLPAKGSNLVFIKKTDSLLKQFSQNFGADNFFMHVGTYEQEDIGESCYHSSLAILESLLSHTITDDNHLLVTDMTAGTDAFAGSLHAQFDLIVMVVEPTQESTLVAKQYKALAEAANVKQFVTFLANKIEDEEDVFYLQSELGTEVIGEVPYSKEIKIQRRSGKSVFDLPISVDQAFDRITTLAQKNRAEITTRLKLLIELHKKHVQADYIVSRHGNLLDQIDESFNYEGISY